MLIYDYTCQIVIYKTGYLLQSAYIALSEKCSPCDVLKEGLSSNRPCIAQIMSWAANRMTTQVEDRAYSLMGLLDMNMPMLYGEGKKAFHCLQLEIIRTSNNQSIFVWGCNTIMVWTGSILADDPSFFWDCVYMELMD